MSETTPHQFAHKFWPNAPSDRDQQIYDLVRVQFKPQHEVAKQFGISPGRVSQIVHTVDQHMMLAVAIDHAPPEEQFRALLLLKRQVDHAAGLALKAFTAQMEPDVEVTQEEARSGDGPAKTRRKRRARAARPDARLLDRYLSACERGRTLSDEIAIKRRDTHKFLSRMPDWKEDHDAEYAVKIAEDLEQYAERCVAAGQPGPILPVFDRKEVEQYVREMRRVAPNMNVIDCFPEGLAQATKRVFMPLQPPKEPIQGNPNVRTTVTPYRSQHVEGDEAPHVMPTMPGAPPTAAPQAPPKKPKTAHQMYSQKSVPTYDPNEPWPPPRTPGLSPMEMAKEDQAAVRWVPGEGYIHRPGSFWYEWHKAIAEGTEFPMIKGPPGGEGITYADGSWLTPDLQFGGGPEGVKSVAEAEAERLKKERAEGKEGRVM